MKYLNLGCGDKYIIDDVWENVDFHGSEHVKGANILQGLPYEDSSVDVVFSSHMLEHFTKSQAKSHVQECYRVLKSNGVIRIVVPDLENICEEYLRILSKVREDESYAKKYEYVILELLDQMTRMESGGEMMKYWESPDSDLEYVAKRSGFDEGYFARQKASPIAKKKFAKLRALYKKIKEYKRELFKKTTAGELALSGELHRWMYDSYSMSCLLRECGFNNIEFKSCNVSDIDNWAKYALEFDSNGNEYKPNSIYVEAIK